MVDALIYLVQVLLSGRFCLDACRVEGGCKPLDIGERHDLCPVAVNLVKQFASIDDRPSRVAFQCCAVQENHYRNELVD